MNIDRLIFDALASRRGVTLPGVGTLEVRRRGARRISDTEIVPPRNVVVYSGDELGEVASVVELMSESGVEHEEASALYGQWLDAARRDGGVIAIPGVGEIREDKFVGTQSLRMALNPAGDEDVMTIERDRRAISWWVWAVLGALVLGLVGLMAYRGGMFGGGTKPGSEAPAIGAEPTIDSLAAFVEGVDADLDAEFGGEIPKTSTGNGVAQSSVNAKPAVTQKPAADKPVAAAKPAAAKPAVKTAAKPAATGAGTFHVIGGSFSVPANADKFVADIRRRFPELTPVKVPNPRTGFMMVSIIQSKTRGEAARKRNLYWDVSPELWIFEQ